MQPGFNERTPGLDLAGDGALGEITRRLQGDQRGLRPLAVSRLERRLQFAQCRCIHSRTSAPRHPDGSRGPSPPWIPAFAGMTRMETPPALPDGKLAAAERKG